MQSDARTFAVRQTTAGRTEAYTELVRRWAGRITALCHARVGRAHLADDLAQETLLRGFRSLSTLHDAERFGPVASGIAVLHLPRLAQGEEERPDSVRYALDANHHPNDCLHQISRITRAGKSWNTTTNAAGCWRKWQRCPNSIGKS